MPLGSLHYGYWEFWAPYDPANGYYGNQKVTFDGENKLIYINPGETNVFVKDDIYSGWKEWVQVRENAKFLDAIRTTGGDPVGGGLYSGDIYFMINGWKVVVQDQVTVTGIIYDDTPGVSPFIVQSGGGVINVVSNLAYAYSQSAGSTPPTVQEIRQEMDSNSTKLSSIDTKVNTLPTKEQIRTEIDTNSTKLQEISTKQDQALTKGDFIALQ